jgi:hypothetical protein
MAELGELSEMEKSCFDYEHFCKRKEAEPHLNFQRWIHQEQARLTDLIWARLAEKAIIKIKDQEARECKHRIASLLAPLLEEPPAKRRAQPHVEDPRMCQSGVIEDAMDCVAALGAGDARRNLLGTLVPCPTKYT